MFWIGILVGIFFGFSIGIVVAGLLWSTKRNDAEDHFNPNFGATCCDGAAGDLHGVPASTCLLSPSNPHMGKCL